jgi:hypothetical protein
LRICNNPPFFYYIVLPWITAHVVNSTALWKVKISIYKLSEDPADYADSSRAILLPFPSNNVVPARFHLSGDGWLIFIHWARKFTTVWEAWLTIKANTRYRQAISDVYGTDGYGKFHILAALACLLVRQKETVVYLPDCRAMLREPLEYLRNALCGFVIL